jgi:MFS transporter, NNP family, nitrate/nitrite transporter
MKWTRASEDASGRANASHFVAVGVMLGIAGASFAVALPLASRWYRPEYQRIALGLVDADDEKVA